ncbi:MAG: ribonuclease Z [Nitrospirae bacterium]|nr:MAG: ribonuclease Z [Nitrospirota bacterium]
MTPSFSPYLVNEPFGDPGLYVEVRWAKRALLFDLGANENLSPTRLLRCTHVFVSHTHMDHFIGFDRLLRIALGRGKSLYLYGPPGLIDNVAGKLRGYTWNLVDGYPLSLYVTEFHADAIYAAAFHATDGFVLQGQTPIGHPRVHGAREGIFPILEEPMFTVRAVALNHRIPSFGYVLEEQFHVNVKKERLHEAGLPVGSWLKEVKQYLWEGKPDDFWFTATLFFEHRREERRFRLGDVKERFVTITRGQKIAYVVDCRYDPDNERKIVELAKEADLFYCEAPYLHRDVDKAQERYHLTAKQAGLLARKAGVRELVVFHFSPRYTGMGDLLYEEAQEAFRGVVRSEVTVTESHE